jgi:hypothetical protein
VKALRGMRANPRYWDSAIKASQLLLSWGYSKPPQLQDTTVNANINNRYAVSFQLSDLAPPGSYIEPPAIEHEPDER